MTCLVLFELFVTNLLLFEHQRKTKYGSGWRKEGCCKLVLGVCVQSGLFQLWRQGFALFCLALAVGKFAIIVCMSKVDSSNWGQGIALFCIALAQWGSLAILYVCPGWTLPTVRTGLCSLLHSASTVGKLGVIMCTSRVDSSNCEDRALLSFA